MNERLKEIEKRFAEIRAELDNENADVDALEKEINELTEERAAILAKAEKRAALEKEVIARGVPMDVVNKELRKEEPQMPVDIRDTAEYRSGFLKTLQGNPLTEAEQRAMTTVNSPGAIPTQTAREIVTKMLEVAPLLTEITLFHVAGALSIGTDLDRDNAYIHTPGAEITASSDTIAQVTLGGYEFFKLIPISKSMKSMSVDEFESWLVDMLYEDVALQIENSIINGTGTNQPSGIESITWTASVNLISTTASISYDDVCNLMTMPVKGLRKGAKFLCNSTFVYQQLAQIKDNNKRPIFVQSMVEGVADRLMGKEVLVSDEVADDTLYFGQMKKIYGNLPSDVDVETSEHSSFRKGLIDYRGGAVFDCKVTAPRAFGKFKKN
jgi:HK97 family phage major capsid protein